MGDFFLFFIERDANPLGKEERRKTARRSCGFEIRLKQEIEFLAPVLLADYKSAIVTHTAADCKSAETGYFILAPVLLADYKSAIVTLYGGGLQIRRNW